MKTIITFLFFIILTSLAFAETPVKIGWIGDITGVSAKYGAYNAIRIAEEEINNAGGINGRPVKLIYEDGRCNGKAAITAFNKLTGIDKVKIILGGHCSPESMAFASTANQRKILTIASITSSPRLSDAGDYIFRLTPISTSLPKILVPYAVNNLKLKNLGLLWELTDYVEPPAEKFAELFKAAGGEVKQNISFNPGETDFRTLLTKLAYSDLDALYIGTQAHDTMQLLLKQIKDLNLKLTIFANEIADVGVKIAPESEKKLFEGVIFAFPECNEGRQEYQSFLYSYQKKYKVNALPFSCTTPEPYDALKMIVQGIKECGEENIECLKNFLYNLKDYPGASGIINFDKNGDVYRTYVIKTIKDGEVMDVSY